MKGSDFENKEILTTSEALRFCRYRGWPVSSTALYYNGLKSGFMRKAENGHHWIFDRAGLSKFLLLKNTDIPKGYLTVAELAKKKVVNLTVLYNQIKDWNVEYIKTGPKSIMYVNEASYDKQKKANERIYLNENTDE